MAQPEYDLDLFLALNEEYRSKPIVPQPRGLDATSVAERGQARAADLQRTHAITGKRVLEIGCGRGEVANACARGYGCDAHGVDIVRYKEWEEWGEGGPSLHVLDISQEDYTALGQFDFIYSYSVWEHMRHPFSALRAAGELLAPGGVFLLYTNLYRGPSASHRYREVFFPWPHLLFPDSVFKQFYRHIGLAPRGADWVNRLTAAEYLLYVELLGLKVDNLRYTVKPIDEDLYRRCEDVLGRYPRFDLERDFMHLLLSHADGETRSAGAAGRAARGGRSAAKAPGAPTRGMAVKFADPLEGHVSRWHARATTVLTREGSGVRCSIVGGTDTSAGQYGGVRFPVDRFQGVRLDVTFQGAEAIRAMYVDGYDASGRRVMRWEWQVGHTGAPGRRETHTFVPGRAAGLFRWIAGEDPAAVKEVDLFLLIAPGGRAGFVLHTAHVLH